LKVFKNYLLNSSYQLLMIIIPLITMPYISRVLGPSGIGLNAFTASIIQYFVMIGSVGISTYGNREIAYNQRDKVRRSQIFWEITSLRFITVSLSLLFFFVFLYFQRVNMTIYLIQGIAILASAFDITWYFMGMENFKRTVGRNFLVSILSVICIFVFVTESSDLPIYIAIVTGSALIGNISLWPFLKREVFSPRKQKLRIKRHLKPTLMLFLPQIATQIYLVVNKNMLGIFDSIDSVGFFGQSDSIIKVTLALVTSLGTVMLPHISNMHSKGDMEGIKKMLSKSFDIMTGLSIPIMFGIMGVSIRFAPFFFGTDFGIVGRLMFIQAPIIIFIAWSNVIGMQYLLPLNKMRQFTTSVSIGAVLNILINLLLIPLFGLFGAMTATIIAELSVTLYQMHSIKDEIQLRNMFKGTWKYFLSGFMMFLVLLYLNTHQTMTIPTLIFQIGVGTILYLLFNIILNSAMYKEVKILFLNLKN